MDQLIPDHLEVFPTSMFNGKFQVGDRIGTWIVMDSNVYRQKKTNHNRAIFHVQCLCGKREKFDYIFNIKNNHYCKHCSPSRCVSGPNALAFKGFGEVPKKYFTSIKSGAIKRNLEFSISIEYIWNLFQVQNRKCALSDEELFFTSIGDNTASLDRIDSSIGYIEGNVQWVHKDINRMKQEFSQQKFIKMCLQVAEKYKMTKIE